MSLSFSRMAGDSRYNPSVQIAKDGDHKIYYIDDPIDALREFNDEQAEDMVSELVDETACKLRINCLSTKKLIDVDSDIMAKEPPRDRYAKRIFAGVKDQLAVMEHKLHKAQNPLRVIPRKVEGQRDGYYIFGPSGCGKSTWVSKFAKEYKIENVGNRVFIFSRKEYDPVFDRDIPGIIRVLLDRNFIRDQQRRPGGEDPIMSYSDSLCIFDDFLKLEDPAIKKAAEHLKNSLYELGRQYNIDICSVQHKGLGGQKSIIELAESTGIVCFPRINLGESERLVAKHLCFSKDQMMRIFDEEGKKERWLTIIRPNIVITEKYIKIID
jgi:hypothetical protein